MVSDFIPFGRHNTEDASTSLGCCFFIPHVGSCLGCVVRDFPDNVVCLENF